MKKHMIAVGAVLFALGFNPAEAKTVGFYMADNRLPDVSGTKDALKKAGWEVVDIRNKGVYTKDEELAKFDALFFAGGFNRYFWVYPDMAAGISRYVARGGGAFFTGFRGGFVRNATRVIFPQIGQVSCRLTSGWIAPEGDSPLAKAFDGRMQAFSSGDHLKVDVGPDGKSFCGVTGMSCGAYGEVGYGRVVVLGAHFSYKPDEETAPALSKILLAGMDWVSSAKKPSAADGEKAAKDAVAAYYRRNLLLDLTIDERGPDACAGHIPMARDYTTTEPEALAYSLQYGAKFVEQKDAKKASALAERLLASAKKVNDLAAKMKDEIKAKIAKLDTEGIKNFDRKPYLTDAAKETFAKLIDPKAVAEAKALIAKMKPEIAAKKLAEIKAELKEDQKLVPGLITKLGTEKCPKARLEAAMELGRIVMDEDPAAVKALVKALDDADAAVRAQAAISLGWMQAKDAVDALAEKANGAETRLANRATQALGLIGSDRAIKPLMKMLKKAQDDRVERQNFRQFIILSLGQLKAKEAVPELLKIAKSTDRKVNSLRTAEAAIVALGYIGDKSVVKNLEALMVANHGDGPRNSRAKPKDTWHFSNPFSIGHHGVTACEYGIEWTSQMATNLIARGGRAEKGVKQGLCYRAKDYFYRITKNCNAFAGRFTSGMRHFRDRTNLLVPHVWEAGGTGFHNAWGTTMWEPESYKDFIRTVGDFDMCFIDVISGGAVASMPEMEYRCEEFKDIPAWQGVWCEETWPEPNCRGRHLPGKAEARYGKDWRKKGILTADELKAFDKLVAEDEYIEFAYICHGEQNKDGELNVETSYEQPWDAGLRTMIIELLSDQFVGEWTETQEYLHARRMGCANTYVVSTADQGRHFGDNRAFNAIDSMSLESYQSFGRSTSYWMQRYRDGNARSGMAELYNWYCPSVEHAKRGFWQNAVHGKCFFNFGLMEIFKHACGEYLWRWEEGRWDAFREVFKRVRDNKEFYRIVPSAAKVAVLYSERGVSLNRNNAYHPNSVPQRADQNAMALWVSLGQSHVQADIVYADYVKIEKLRKYSVLVLNDARYLSDDEVAILRQWVKEGGVLISEGDASLFDSWTAKMRANYALADVFGADYVKTDYLPENEADTFCRRRGDSRASFRFVPGLEGKEARYHSEDPIHRDQKPSKGIAQVKFGDITAEIDAAVGIDRVKPTTAKVVATFADGKPAILENAFGKGKSYFQCSAYPAMGHVTSEWEMMPNKWDFWPGNREMLERLVRDGLKHTATEQAVEVAGLTGDVEVTVDDHGGKLVVHLLDYNVQNQTVKGGSLTIPGTCAVKRVYYPDTKTELPLSGRTVKLRDFSAYDMLAIEFE